MKKILLLAGILMLTSLHGNAQIAKQEQSQNVDVATNVFDSIQHKIENAMYTSFISFSGS